MKSPIPHYGSPIQRWNGATYVTTCNDSTIQPSKKMPIIRFKRFNKPHILKHIGRELLAQLFEKFKPDFDARSLPLPPPQLADADYFTALSRLLMCPEELPDRLN